MTLLQRRRWEGSEQVANSEEGEGRSLNCVVPGTDGADCVVLLYLFFTFYFLLFLRGRDLPLKHTRTIVLNLFEAVCLSLNDDTKILTETETDTFLPRPNFPKPKPKLFSETKFFRNRNRDFFSETKFFETETLKNLAKVSRLRPKPILFNIFWNEIRKNWDLQAKLECLGPKFGILIVTWVKIISARKRCSEASTQRKHSNMDISFGKGNTQWQTQLDYMFFCYYLQCYWSRICWT